MCNKQQWTEEEIQFLEDNVGKLKMTEIAERLSRSYSSVNNKIIRLGLIDKPCRWTKEETQFLKDNIDTMRYEDIAKALNKSVDAVQGKTKRLNLTHSRDYELYLDDYITIEEASEMLNVSREIIDSLIKRGIIKKARPKIKNFAIKIWLRFSDIYKLAKSKNIVLNRRPNYKQWTTYEICLMVSMYKVGKTKEEIAKRLNRTVDSVRTKLWRTLNEEENKESN